MAQLREVGRDFVLLYRELDLFGGEEVVADDSFFSADASRGSIQTKDYIERQLESIEKKIEEYHKALDEQDIVYEKGERWHTGNDEGLREKIKKLRKNQEQKERMQRCVNTQVAAVDPDARLRRNGYQAGDSGWWRCL